MTMIQERQSALECSIQHLYEVFGDYPISDHFDESPYEQPYDTTELFAFPLDRIPAHAIDRYSWKALTTWGTVEDLKHFLPRLLELAIAPDSEAEHLETPVVFGKLKYGEWTSWPQRERDAVSRFLDALWAYAIASPPDVLRVHTVFCSAEDCLGAIRDATDAIGPYLDRWLDETTNPEIGYRVSVEIADTVLSSAEYLSLKGTSGWEGIFDEWLQSRELADCLEKAFFKYSEAEHGRKLSDAEAFVRSRIRLRERKV